MQTTSSVELFSSHDDPEYIQVADPITLASFVAFCSRSIVRFSFEAVRTITETRFHRSFGIRWVCNAA